MKASPITLAACFVALGGARCVMGQQADPTTEFPTRGMDIEPTIVDVRTLPPPVEPAVPIEIPPPYDPRPKASTNSPTAGSSTPAPAPTTTVPLSYSTTFTDPSGSPQTVSFTGTANGTSLTGTLTVNGAPEQVTATIGSDGSVSGKFLNPDGSQYGAFWGRPRGPSSMQGSFDLNGQVGGWSAPLRVPVPSTTSQ